MPPPTPNPKPGCRRGKPARRRRGFVAAPQYELDLEPTGTLDQRIAWGETTAAIYKKFACDAATPTLRASFERHAARWGKHVLDLIDERRRTQAQLELF